MARLDLGWVVTGKTEITKQNRKESTNKLSLHELLILMTKGK